MMGSDTNIEGGIIFNSNPNHLAIVFQPHKETTNGPRTARNGPHPADKSPRNAQQGAAADSRRWSARRRQDAKAFSPLKLSRRFSLRFRDSKRTPHRTSLKWRKMAKKWVGTLDETTGNDPKKGIIPTDPEWGRLEELKNSSSNRPSSMGPFTR